MGMSASQARLLSLTARMNDIEFKSQSISNTKIRLADESEQVAKAYTEALNKQKFSYTTYDDKGNAVKYALNSTNLSQLKDSLKLFKGGKEVVFSQEEADKDPNNKVFMKFSESQLYEMIESGEFMLYSKTEVTEEEFAKMSSSTQNAYKQFTEKAEDGTTVKKYWSATSTSGNNKLMQESDTTELAKAEAEYNAASAKINKKEKLLDNDLKALDTEHNALKTEFDSVKSLIGENVEKTFNLFS